MTCVETGLHNVTKITIGQRLFNDFAVFTIIAHTEDGQALTISLYDSANDNLGIDYLGVTEDFRGTERG